MSDYVCALVCVCECTRVCVSVCVCVCVCVRSHCSDNNNNDTGGRIETARDKKDTKCVEYSVLFEHFSAYFYSGTQ